MTTETQQTVREWYELRNYYVIQRKRKSWRFGAPAWSRRKVKREGKRKI